MSTIALQLLSISAAILQRQAVHNEAASRNYVNREYDYIVVGAGTAGSIVATRLAQDGQKVLLLEAGPGATIMNDMPSAFPLSLDGSLDWGYSTTPQTKLGQMWASKRVAFPRGKILGGSSTINFMIYNRGNREDFDNWAFNYGCGEQWSYHNLLPYFMKAERFANSSVHPESSSYHGYSGPMAVSIPMHRDPIHRYWESAWNGEGYSSIDINGPSQVGVSIFHQTIDPWKNWFRAGTAHAYLYPNMYRRNLHIIVNAHVTKVLFRRRNVAYAVEYQRDGQRSSVRARKEIILSAGAINSPQILMLSGIGPRAHLEQLNISVLADLPVGVGLQDHILVPNSFLVNDQSSIDWGSLMFTRPTTITDLYAYWVDKTGPLTTRTLTAVYHATSKNINKQWPDGIVGLFVNQIAEPMLQQYQLSTDYAAWSNYYTPLVNDQRYFDIIVGLYRVFSRGSVRLQSNDPFTAPLIDPNFLADPRDAEALLDMMQRTYRTTEGSYFRQYATQYSAIVPGCQADACAAGTPRSQCLTYLACVIRMLGSTSWHPTSTVQMGTHFSAVLNPKNLRVNNIKRLRVIDASVMPEVPNGNTNAPTIAIAEKGAELILADSRKFILPSLFPNAMDATTDTFHGQYTDSDDDTDKKNISNKTKKQQ